MLGSLHPRRVVPRHHRRKWLYVALAAVLTSLILFSGLSAREGGDLYEQYLTAKHHVLQFVGVDMDRKVGADMDGKGGVDIGEKVGVDMDGKAGVDVDETVGVDMDGKVGADTDGKVGVDMDGKIGGYPPNYEHVYAYEDAMPQHDPNSPYPEGRHGRFVRFSSQITGLGWNNVLGEVLINAHLAWRANRAYVFDDYWWKYEYYPWRHTSWPHSPLNAFIGGPVAGGPWEAGDAHPRAIHTSHFDAMCPPEDTDIIDTDVAKEPVRLESGTTVMEHWVRLLDNSPKRCVDIVAGPIDKYPQVFDLWLVSQKRILDFWPEFRDSPISRLLTTSPIVDAAIHQNTHLFSPSSYSTQTSSSLYDGVMAVHIRRGDYADACTELADANATFYGWNLLPSHPDPFTWTVEEKAAMYKERCFPTEAQLVAKIETAKTEWEAQRSRRGDKLDVLYVMTNAKKGWVDNEFKPAMRRLGWKTVVSSHDLVLDDEQLGVSMAVDMEYGRLAAVFIGNGWSSMTNNINHRRLIDGRQPLDNRFW